MAGYWMVRSTASSDDDAAQKYIEHWKPIAERYKAKVLASSGEHQTVEGEDKPRNLIVEFPSYQDALDCYNSQEYKEAMEFVNRAFVRELVIIEGNS